MKITLRNDLEKIIFVDEISPGRFTPTVLSLYPNKEEILNGFGEVERLTKKLRKDVREKYSENPNSIKESEEFKFLMKRIDYVRGLLYKSYLKCSDSIIFLMELSEKDYAQPEKQKIDGFLKFFEEQYHDYCSELEILAERQKTWGFSTDKID